MLGEIFRFELRYQLRQPLFWLSGLAFFLLSFGAVTTDAVIIGGAIGDVDRNAPYVIMQILLVMSILGVFVTTALVANPMLRDIDHRTQQFFLTTHVRKRDYLVGRYAGAMTVALGIFVPVALAVWVGSLMPWLDPERIGPLRLGPYLFAFAVFVVPNLLITGTAFFSVATLSRSMMWTYAAVVALFVAYIVSQQLLADIDDQTVAALLDPFGTSAFAEATRYWTVAERNTQVLELRGVLLHNRLLWLGFAAALFALNYFRFTLGIVEARGRRESRGLQPGAGSGSGNGGGGWARIRRSGRGGWWRRAREGEAGGGGGGGSGRAGLAADGASTAGAAADGGSGTGAAAVGRAEAAGGAPARAAAGAVAGVRVHAASAVRDFSFAGQWRQYARQVRVEVGATLRSLPFVIIVVLGVLNVVGNSTVVDQLFGTPVHPVTHLMIGVIQSGFLLYVLILLTLYSGELVWRDRQRDTADVVDAMPVPTWVLWASKMTALVFMIAALLAVGALTTMCIQAAKGYFHFEPGLYAKGLLLNAGIPFVLMAALAIFAQVVTNHKFAGILVMLLYFISEPVLGALDFNHNLYQYAGSPPVPYSDMNGYGRFDAAVAWFDLYWAFAAVVVLALAHLFWVRGRDTARRFRMRAARRRLRGPAVGTLGVAFVGFVGTGSFIFYNTNVLNDYVPGDELELRRVEYEKEYKRYEGLAQPRIVSIETEVDIYPERQDAEIRGTYRLVNKTDSPIETLHLTLDPRVELRELRTPEAALEHRDSVQGHRIYRLAEPLAPGDTVELGFDIGVITRGFVNGGLNTNVVRNGTFFTNGSYFPGVGYNARREVQDPNVRRKHGLEPVQRMPAIDAAGVRGRNYLTGEADWVDFEAVVSTSPDQIALAPGYLEREWEERGRRYFRYAMDAPILPLVGFLSAEWAVARDRWNDVAIEVYHHPAHEYNVDRMIESVKRSLDYFTENFGPYQHRQLRILEFPRYARFAQSLPNTIPFSESIGFIARVDGPDAIDYVFYVTAHEVAHQWWAHQVIGAHAQGSTMLSETLAQYSALMVMEEEYGPQKMRRFLKYELDRYLAGRGGELIGELPLLLVENQGYIHYRKGSLVMYALRDYIGEDAVNRALARFLDEWRFEGPPYPKSTDLLAYIREETPADRQHVLTDLFETITLYGNRAVSASYSERDDGRYAVRLEIEARKYRADRSGAEEEIAVDDWIDVGVFGEEREDSPPEGEVLYLEKHRVAAADTVIEVVVDEVPVRAGIDPFNKLIDRNPEDNLVRVGAGGG